MKRHFVNDDFFSIIDSEKKAYLLGFFIADGTIGMNERCKNSYFMQINICNDDNEILKMYQSAICPENKITICNYQGGGVKHRRSTGKLKWTSNKMKDDLNSYNIHSKKTYDSNFIFPMEKIPEVFIWDFIRGYFDGDGQISYNEKTKVSTFAICGTSKPFLEQLGKKFEKQFGVKMRIENSGKVGVTLWYLRFFANYNRKKFFKALCEKFYKDKIYFLKRKRDKFQKYLMFKYRANQTDIERLFDSVERS